MAKPHQIAISLDGVEDAITAGEHLLEFSPPRNPDLLRPFPSEAAILPPHMAKPHQIAISLDGVEDAVPPENTCLSSPHPMPTFFGPSHVKLPSSRPTWRNHIKSPPDGRGVLS